MIIHVFRIRELMYLVDSTECLQFRSDHPDSEEVGIVPCIEEEVRVH